MSVSQPDAFEPWNAIAATADAELRQNILPFWLRHAPAPDRSAFHGRVEHDLKVARRAARGALLSSRILWTFAAAFRRYADTAYLEMAQRAYRDLTLNFADANHGGYYWSISQRGRPLVTHKQIYGQAFALYALIGYHRATGERRALDQAIELFGLIDRHAHDARHGGYFDVLRRDWSGAGCGVPNALSRDAAAKSQNSHIHILEAFSELLRVWPDPQLRARLHELIELILTRILDPGSHHLIQFMAADWTPLGPPKHSYGHDIELSWLLVEAARVLGEPDLLQRAEREALEIARVTATEGVGADGGLCDAGDASGATDFGKQWWPQAEAAIGFYNAYQISGDPRWAVAARRSWDFIVERFVDRKHGDWHTALDRSGTPLEHPKIGFWKCPYHSSRACLELIARIEQLRRTTDR